ncbi:DCC1-like thiol-disulfide oxidoreductase family protein [Micromonospora sp. NPDC048909]|uniref:thiol-disulfide oxidoreductase DCC family protein n=1 Tax=Micromonospora sp. NPDC048909 TaxID=3155643 RepID=UPI0033EBB242
MTVSPSGGAGGLPDPTLHNGGGGIRGFTVLYDAYCPLCRTARRWLASRPQLVPLEFLPAGSADARRRFPGLDHDATLRDLTVVADTGEVYAGDGAWFACLWALTEHRAAAERLAHPHLLPLARRVIATAAAVRERVREPRPAPDDERAGYGDDDDRADCPDDRWGRAGDGPG